ncbi:MAG TPA: DMT family transporter [Steroidobacteraceae bacterium]|jgi:drug/metabolite transporter (DMT)-like permease|nr:DMT family transporter [Steroidobacteraceae bacterium]
MPLAALLAVLLAALTHASWNLVAKSAARSAHFVWLYSTASLVMWMGPVIWVLLHSHWPPGPLPWLALGATVLLHLAYSLSLQAGYRAADLSLVYPIARGTGPLLSFAGATWFLGERTGLIPVIGVLLVVLGIALVADLGRTRLHSPRAGILWGLLTGTCIASYTLNDGWAVKFLAISPIVVDYSGNLFRAVVLAPRALADRPQLRGEIREYGRAALTVGVLGPLGYILVLWAMTIAPISHVAPARELATLIGTYFGSRLLKEPVGWIRLIGALSIVLGVVCLAAAN